MILAWRSGRPLATFYLHFDGISAVVDELLEEALGIAEQEGRAPGRDLIEFMDWLVFRCVASIVQSSFVVDSPIITGFPPKVLYTFSRSV